MEIRPKAPLMGRPLTILWLLVAITLLLQSCFPRAERSGSPWEAIDSDPKVVMQRAISLVSTTYLCERYFYQRLTRFVTDTAVLRECSEEFVEAVELGRAVLEPATPALPGDSICIGALLGDNTAVYWLDIARGEPEKHGRDTGQKVVIVREGEGDPSRCPLPDAGIWDRPDNMVQLPRICESSQEGGPFVSLCELVEKAAQPLSDTIAPILEEPAVQRGEEVLSISGDRGGTDSYVIGDGGKAVCATVDVDGMSIGVKVIIGIWWVMIPFRVLFSGKETDVATQETCTIARMDRWRLTLELAVLDSQLG